MIRQHHFGCRPDVQLESHSICWSLAEECYVFKAAYHEARFLSEQWTLFFCGCCKDLYAD